LTESEFEQLIGRRVNLLKKWFGGHPGAESSDARIVRWPGQSGTEYTYEVYPIDAVLPPVPGNYIYARQLEDGGWVPIYIAQTRDLHQRLEGHVSLEDAMANGATHLHVHFCTTTQAARYTEERDLVRRWRPLCNDPIET